MRETERGLFWHWGRWMYRLRWLIVTLWVVLFASLSFLALQTPSLLTDNGFTPKGSESDLALSELQAHFEFTSSSIQVVFESETLDLTASHHQSAIHASLEEVSQLPFVESIHFIQAAREKGNDGIVAVHIPLQLTTDEALLEFPRIRELIQPPDGMNVYITGGTAVLYDMQEASKKDIVRAELFGLPIALTVLLIIFGTVPAALLPMIVGVTSVTVTLGIVYFLAQHFSFSNFLPSMVTMLGLAVGIDYALFMVSRFREELVRQSAIEHAVAVTCQRAGKSIFFSGIAVVIGLVGMLLIDLNFFRSLGVGGILVVTFSVIIANTLLLSLFSFIGHRINALQALPKSWKTKQQGSRTWEKIAYQVMKRPFMLVSLLILLFVSLTFPLKDMKLGVPGAEVLPPTYDSRAGSDLLQQVYDQRELDPIRISVLTPQEVWEEETIERIRQYIAELEQLQHIRRIDSYLHVTGLEQMGAPVIPLQQEEIRQQLEQLQLAKGHAALISVIPETDLDSPETEQLVRDIRSIQLADIETKVTGETAYRMDILDRIYEGIPYVLCFVMIVTFMILMFAFHSILLPLKAVLMNVLSLGASLGIVVAVFQFGYFSDILRITSIGEVNAMLPVLVFCVVFGISMDYEVFLISRIAEEYEKTGDNERSTANGLMITGRLITSAALILIIVVGTFIFADIEIMKALGLALALAVFIDATIVRVILVPAFMKLLGRANWWAPKWLKPLRSEE